MMSIVLRTVCGCERIAEIPHERPPDKWRVPYLRRDGLHIWTQEQIPLSSRFKTRTFEYTGTTGKYGYPLYLEVLEKIA